MVNYLPSDYPRESQETGRMHLLFLSSIWDGGRHSIHLWGMLIADTSMTGAMRSRKMINEFKSQTQQQNQRPWESSPRAVTLITNNQSGIQFDPWNRFFQQGTKFWISTMVPCPQEGGKKRNNTYNPVFHVTMESFTNPNGLPWLASLCCRRHASIPDPYRCGVLSTLNSESLPLPLVLCPKTFLFL